MKSPLDFNSISAWRAYEKEQAAVREQRVAALRAIFDGAIRYNEMLIDHPDWTDEECLAFAGKWHVVAQMQFAERGPDLTVEVTKVVDGKEVTEREGRPSGWNNRIPYCRNDHAKANLERPAP